MVIIKRSECPFLSRRQATVVKRFVYKKAHNIFQEVLTKCDLLFIKTHVAIPCIIIQSAISGDVLCNTVVLHVLNETITHRHYKTVDV